MEICHAPTSSANFKTHAIINHMEGFSALIAFFIGWFLSQTIKIFVEWAKLGKVSAKEVFALLVKARSGGMPSGHTASFGALITFLGLWQGFNSAIFALGLGVFAIVVYDALNVRRSVGEIGKVMKKEGKLKKAVEGHTVLEVIAGGLIGIAVGLSVFLLTK